MVLVLMTSVSKLFLHGMDTWVLALGGHETDELARDSPGYILYVYMNDQNGTE